MSRKHFFKEKGGDLPDGDLVSHDVAQAVYRCLLDPMIVIDEQGLVVEFNQASEKLFGYSRDDAQGKLLSDLIIPEEMREAHARGIEHFLKTGEGPVIGKRIEIEAIRSDGVRFPVELGVAHTNLEGKHLFVAMIRDLSTEKLLEAENIRVRRYLDLIMENSPSVFYLLSQQAGQRAVFKWVSPNITKILGVDPDDLMLQKINFNSLIHEDDHDRVQAAQEEIWEAGEGSQEYRVTSPDSGLLWIRDSQRVLSFESDEVREIVGTFQDITESRAGEERERTLRRELDHRVKNNLQIILGVCDKAAESDVLDKDSMVGLAARIRSMSLVHQLLADGGWRPIDLGEVIRQGVLGLAGESAWSKVQMHGNELFVGVDAAMTLGSVINELITNASKYGGLTSDGRGVDASWSIEILNETAFMKLSWLEKMADGYEASFDRRSFGIQLIESMIPYELDGEVDLEIIDGGVSFQATIPLENCMIDIGRVRGQVRDEETR